MLPIGLFSDVDRAIGKLTDVRFFRDLRAVSDLTQHSKPGAFAHATATAMHKGSCSITAPTTAAVSALLTVLLACLFPITIYFLFLTICFFP